MLQVGVNGYGTIGKRVADAVEAQPDMSVVGIAKTSPDYGAAGAARRGYAIHAPNDRYGAFEDAGYEVAGDVDDLIEAADLIVDATPGGVGATYLPRYREAGTPAIFQGKEDHGPLDASFVARANFEEAVGADYVRVVSCNTTGLARLLAPVDEAFGIRKVRATLVRRAGDPDQPDRGPINDILPNPVTLPSHHGPDVNTVLPDLAIDTMGLKVPVTLMHVHSVNVELETRTSAEEVRARLADENRLFVIDDTAGLDATGKLKTFAKDIGRPRGDLWENCVWGESIAVNGRDLYLFQAIHQESDVIPENVDAIRAMAELADREESMATTDEALGVGLDADAHRLVPPTP